MKKILKEVLSTSLYLLVVLCTTYLIIHFVLQMLLKKRVSIK